MADLHDTTHRQQADFEHSCSTSTLLYLVLLVTSRTYSVLHPPVHMGQRQTLFAYEHQHLFALPASCSCPWASLPLSRSLHDLQWEKPLTAVARPSARASKGYETYRHVPGRSCCLGASNRKMERRRACAGVIAEHAQKLWATWRTPKLRGRGATCCALPRCSDYFVAVSAVCIMTVS